MEKEILTLLQEYHRSKAKSSNAFFGRGNVMNLHDFMVWLESK